MTNFCYKRPQLAIAYSDSLEGKGIANARSGLFLAGPRRVGKSTFLIEDLIPEVEKRGWLPIYVDLWANKNSDPAILITEAIKNKLVNYQGKIQKLAKAIKIDKVNILGTVALKFTNEGFPENMTLTDGLRLLNELSQKSIVLIIDEAQHALTSKNGLNAMFAIKSARDQLNSLLKITSLMLVFTGSNRDKLAHLVLKKDQPFFGSDVTSFPLLNKDYTDAFTEWANKGLADSNQFSKDSMWQAFKLVGHRPEILRQIAGRIALDSEACHFAALLEKDALIWHNKIWNEFENEFNSLTPLQQAIMEVLMEKGKEWSPFSEDCITRYKQISGLNEISTATVQSAIQSLRERDFIWQSGRGIYALEDESVLEWFKHYRINSR